MLRLAEYLERINICIGDTIRWFALLMVLTQFVIVLLRYVFGISFIFLNETVLYMHGALFMLGAGYTLLVDKHVRVDIFYASMSAASKRRVDLFGHVAFLLPPLLLIIYFTWPSVWKSWSILEGAISVGGVPASFLLKSLIPGFCGLLILQGLACLLRDFLQKPDEFAQSSQKSC